MPQMAPINWLSLYFIFILVYIMVIMLYFFTLLNPMKNLMISINTTNMLTNSISN